MIVSWGNVLTASLQSIWLGVANFIPTLLAAITIAIVGWIIGAIFFKLVESLVRFAKVDNALKAAGLDKIVEKAGFRLNSGYFLGKLVEWFFIIVFLVAAFDIFGLTQVTMFLSSVLGYLPQVIVSVLIILIAALVAEAMQKVVMGSAKTAGLKSANLAGTIAKWAIWVFAVLIAVQELGIAVSFINTLFTGIVIAVALALGLAFGLGGQSAAADYIEKIKGEISNKM